MLMRTLAAAGLMLTPQPASAGEWTSYQNTLLGYRLDVPPDFYPEGAPTDDGAGQVFLAADYSAELRIWGGTLSEDFVAETKRAHAEMEKAGLSTSFSARGQNWFAFSGAVMGAALHRRIQLSCDGQHYVAFELTYAPFGNSLTRDVLARLGASVETDAC